MRQQSRNLDLWTAGHSYFGAWMWLKGITQILLKKQRQKYGCFGVFCCLFGRNWKISLLLQQDIKSSPWTAPTTAHTNIVQSFYWGSAVCQNIQTVLWQDVCFSSYPSRAPFLEPRGRDNSKEVPIKWAELQNTKLPFKKPVVFQPELPTLFILLLWSESHITVWIIVKPWYTAKIAQINNTAKHDFSH